MGKSQKINIEGGYYKNKMSNRAVKAYEKGAKPISKWTKQVIVKELEKYNNLNFNLLNLETLRNEFLNYSEWHHTAKFYNVTDFYVLDKNKAINMNMEMFEELLKIQKEEKSLNDNIINKNDCKIRYVKVLYIEFEGSRRHPKTKEIISFGTISGNWFKSLEGNKKMVSGKHFSVIYDFETEQEMLLSKENAEKDAEEKKNSERNKRKRKRS